MGLLPCPLPCNGQKDKESQSESNSKHLHSDSSTSSLSSQSSLPSVPSLASFSSQLKGQQTPAVDHQCLATLKGQSSSYVSSLALSGKFLYSGSSNSEIRVWKPDPNSLLEKISHANKVANSNGAVKSIVVLGDKLFSAHQDHKIRVWRIDNNNSSHNYDCLASLPTTKDCFLKFFLAKNYVQVRRHKKCTWVHHVDTVSALAISRDCSLLYSASWDRTFKVWRTSDFRCLESVKNAHDDAINAIVLSNDGFVYTGSADKKIKVWKKHIVGEKKHSLVETMEAHQSAVNALALSTDGSVLYSGACDRSILVWERDTRAEVNTKGGGHMVLTGALRGHTKAILCLAVVSDIVCSGSADSTVRIWKRGLEKSYTCLVVLEGHRRPVKCLTAAIDTNDGRSSSDSGTAYLVCSGSLDCDMKIWHIWDPILQHSNKLYRKIRN